MGEPTFGQTNELPQKIREAKTRKILLDQLEFIDSMPFTPNQILGGDCKHKCTMKPGFNVISSTVLLSKLLWLTVK